VSLGKVRRGRLRKQVNQKENTMSVALKKSELSVMDNTGDTKYIWDIDNQVEVDIAEETFNSLKAKNYIAYTVGRSGKKGEVIKDFDPELGKIIMIPPVVGG
jgi:hypothetical protein